jgi:hypothetical protein
MVCAIAASSTLERPLGDIETDSEPVMGDQWLGDFVGLQSPPGNDLQCTEGKDPFDDFEDDDFDDEFDDDFEEDWEDDLTEDDEFPDTFGGAEPEEEEEVAEPEESPFADDPDFDDA